MSARLGVTASRMSGMAIADEFKYTIGLAGLMGFGVGCCRPELLPADMAPMPGCEDRWSPNYGNYIHIPSASIMCFLPKHFIDIQGGANTNAPTYGQPIVISNTQTGNAVLARAFRNGGGELEGIFVDKYHPSNWPPGWQRPAEQRNGQPWRDAGYWRDCCITSAALAGVGSGAKRHTSQPVLLSEQHGA